MLKLKSRSGQLERSNENEKREEEKKTIADSYRQLQTIKDN